MRIRFVVFIAAVRNFYRHIACIAFVVRFVVVVNFARFPNAEPKMYAVLLFESLKPSFESLIAAFCNFVHFAIAFGFVYEFVCVFADIRHDFFFRNFHALGAEKTRVIRIYLFRMGFEIIIDLFF